MSLNEISKVFEPQKFEENWYKYWMKNGFFKSVPDEREPYTIVIPPPNVTGVLHMGHMLNNTIQDVLIRKARMEGKNACWVPGTDHASIATEARVVAMLKDKGIHKKDLSREEFLKYAWEWKEKYGGIILDQLKKLGASCDWDRTRFTMEEDLSAAVIKVFVDLYNKGEIYRGVRMVNWDPAGKTAVSDEEVNFKEVHSKLFFVKYEIEGSNGEFITIATTRPETIPGDTAVCVHPEDERYKALKGKKIIIPIVNRVVPLIFDEYITMEFGTGALKVTPAHDINDHNLGQKHGLEIIDTIDEDGKMNQHGGSYIGQDRFVARKNIVKDLEALGLIVKTEDIKNKVGYSERTDAVIEPKLSMQWFLKMDRISRPALKSVMEDEIKLIPEKFKNTYRNWMENVHDWCISRQLWWGQRIPAWYLPDGDVVVSEVPEKALELAQKKHPGITMENLRQDEDVLDTWFSSWLWPISVFDGFKNPENKDFKYYYPTNDLVTAPEILFFWVARMIIAGYEYTGKKPFDNVYLTGIVRDKLGRKMSKSLGNSPDPLELMGKFGADGVRVGMLLCSPAGNDLLFDESLCEQGRNFSNKLWNAFRLVKGWEINEKEAQPANNKISGDWFREKLRTSIIETNDHYKKFRISDALMTIYKLVWDDFCSWYLEMIKPEMGKSIDLQTYNETITFFEGLLKLLHPLMPFISEEIWHLLKERTVPESLIVSPWPVAEKEGNTVITEDFKHFYGVVTNVRNIRNQKNIPVKEPLILYRTASEPHLFDALIKKLSNIAEINFGITKPDGISFLSGTTEYVLVIKEKINPEEEIKKLSAEIEYNRGFLNSVTKKLANEKFIENARPEVIEHEKKKMQDAEAKLRILEEQLSNYKNR